MIEPFNLVINVNSADRRGLLHDFFTRARDNTPLFFAMKV